MDLRNNIVTRNGWYGIKAYAFDGTQQTIGYNDVWNNSWDDYSDVEPGQGAVSDDPMYVQPVAVAASKAAGDRDETAEEARVRAQLAANARLAKADA